MSSESNPSSDDSTAAVSEGGLTTTLAAAYRDYVGEPANERDIYVGFGAFFTGIALGVVALIVFLASGTQTTGTALYWQLRELALVAGLLGLPVVVASIVVLLPVGRRTQAISAAGIVCCVVAIALLVNFYPYDWTRADGVDSSVITISVYAVGLVLLATATGTALVAQYLDSATADATLSEPSPVEGDDSDSATVTDDAVEADIEAAMEGAELSWGGVDKQQQTKRLSFDMPDADADLGETIDDAEATTTRAAGSDVDEAVDGLRGLQGGETETARSSSPDDQVEALTNFREQQEAEEDLETGVDEPGVFEKLRRKLFD